MSCLFGLANLCKLSKHWNNEWLCLSHFSDRHIILPSLVYCVCIKSSSITSFETTVWKWLRVKIWSTKNMQCCDSIIRMSSNRNCPWKQLCSRFSIKGQPKQQPRRRQLHDTHHCWYVNLLGRKGMWPSRFGRRHLNLYCIKASVCLAFIMSWWRSIKQNF